MSGKEKNEGQGHAYSLAILWFKSSLLPAFGNKCRSECRATRRHARGFGAHSVRPLKITTEIAAKITANIATAIEISIGNVVRAGIAIGVACTGVRSSGVAIGVSGGIESTRYFIIRIGAAFEILRFCRLHKTLLV